MKKLIRSSSDIGLTVYRSNTVPMFDYRSIPNKADLGIHCGSKLSAYVVATHYSQKSSFIDELKINPTNILDSEDCDGNWSQPSSINSMKLPRNTREELIRRVLDSGESVRDVLLDMGYDCIRYINDIEDVGDYSYIILDTSIISSVKNNATVNFRGLFGSNLSQKRIDDLTNSDMIYMTNGMYDVGIAYYRGSVYSDGQYEVEGEIICNLNFNHKYMPGDITNMFTHSDEIEVVTSIPDIFR